MFIFLQFSANFSYFFNLSPNISLYLLISLYFINFVHRVQTQTFVTIFTFPSYSIFRKRYRNIFNPFHLNQRLNLLFFCIHPAIFLSYSLVFSFYSIRFVFLPFRPLVQIAHIQYSTMSFEKVFRFKSCKTCF